MGLMHDEEIDEDTEQIKAISIDVGNVILGAFRKRFTRFDHRERDIILNSMMYVIASYLASLSYEERKQRLNYIVEAFLKIST